MVLKPVNEIRFIRHITVRNKHYNNHSLELDILRVTYFLTSITIPDPNN